MVHDGVVKKGFHSKIYYYFRLFHIIVKLYCRLLQYTHFINTILSIDFEDKMKYITIRKGCIIILTHTYTYYILRIN